MATSCRRTPSAAFVLPPTLAGVLNPSEVLRDRESFLRGAIAMNSVSFPESEGEIERMVEATRTIDLTPAGLRAWDINQITSDVARAERIVASLLTVTKAAFPSRTRREVVSEDGLRRYRVEDGVVKVNPHANGLFFEAEHIPTVDVQIVADLIANPTTDE